MNRAVLQGLRVSALAVALHAVLSAQAPPPAQKGNQTLSGIVVNSVTGDPIPRALVNLAGRSPILTGNDGRFEFHNLPYLQGFVTVHKPGFFSEQEIAQGQLPENLTVQTGPESRPLVAKLIPEGVVSGHVTSETGPIEGVQVVLIASRIREGRRRWEPQGSANTNEDGEFRIANLMPGSYFLALAPQWDPKSSAPGSPPHLRGYAESYYPGVPDLDSATPLDVAPGQQLEADLRAKLTPVYGISGSLAGAMSPSGASFQFASPSGQLSEFVTDFNDETGEFHANVPAGSYILKARGQSAENQQVGADLPLDVNGPLRGITLALAPMPSIALAVHAVHARTAQKQPAYRIVRNASTSSSFDSVGVYFSSTTALSSVQFFAASGGPKKQQPAIQSAEPGKYRVEAQSQAGWYVAELRCGDIDLLSHPLDVQFGTRLPPVEVEVRDDGAEVLASMFSQGASTPGSIVLVPSRAPDQAQVRAVSVDTQAGFQDLAPGDYTVIAFDSIDGLEYKNPEALQEYMGQGTHVEVAASQVLEVKLDVVHRAR